MTSSPRSSARHLVESVNRGDTAVFATQTAADLMEATLERVRDVVQDSGNGTVSADPGIFGITTLTPDLGHRLAEKVDQFRQSRQDRQGWQGPLPDLAGLPIAVKDLFPIAGVPCTWGSARLTTVPERHSPAVTALLRRGATIPFTTSTSEIGATAYTEPTGLTAPDNPRLPGHTPGGSSGGSAVAVASGLVSAALASDGGGSIRVPAASVGLVGLKPAHDISSGALSTTGFLTRSLEDCALLNCLPKPTRAGETGRGTCRVGVTVEPFHEEGDVGKRWKEAALTAADVLSNAGHDVVEIPHPYPDSGVFELFRDTITHGIGALPDADYSPMVRWIREQGQAVSTERVTANHQRRLQLGTRVQQRWAVDIALTPTLAFDPPPIGTFSSKAPEDDFIAQTRWTPWLSLWNLTGWAGLSIPCGGAGASVHLGAVSDGRDAEAMLLNVAADLIDPTIDVTAGWRTR